MMRKCLAIGISILALAPATGCGDGSERRVEIVEKTTVSQSLSNNWLIVIRKEKETSHISYSGLNRTSSGEVEIDGEVEYVHCDPGRGFGFAVDSIGQFTTFIWRTGTSERQNANLRTPDHFPTDKLNNIVATDEMGPVKVALDRSGFVLITSAVQSTWQLRSVPDIPPGIENLDVNLISTVIGPEYPEKVLIWGMKNGKLWSTRVDVWESETPN